MRVKLALAGLLALAASSLAPSVAEAACTVGRCWGAVAFGAQGAWAYAYNYPSRASASQHATARCGGRCSRVLTFENSCGAYAVGSTGYGWGNAHDRQPAISRALQECRARSANCQLRVWACTTR